MSLAKIEIMMEVMQERMREMQREMKMMEKKYEERIETLQIQHTKEIKQLEGKITQGPQSSVYDNAVVNMWWHAQMPHFVKIGIEKLDIPDTYLQSVNIDAFSSLFKLNTLSIDVQRVNEHYISEKFQQMKSTTITHFTLKNVYNGNVKYEYLPDFVNLETLEIFTHEPYVPNLVHRLNTYSKLKYLKVKSTCWNGFSGTLSSLRPETIDELTAYCPRKGITLKIE